MSPIRALKLSDGSILRVLTTTCGISEAFSAIEIQQGIPHPPIKEFTAVWDTGASSSAISPRVVTALG